MGKSSLRLKRPDRSTYGKPVAHFILWRTCDNPAHCPMHDETNYTEACGRIHAHIMAGRRWKKLYPTWNGKLPDPCPCRECNQERREVARWEHMAREALRQYRGPIMSEREARALQHTLPSYYELRHIGKIWVLYSHLDGEHEFIWSQGTRQRCKYVAIMGKMLYEVEESA